MLEKIKSKIKFNIGWKSLILIGVCVALVLVDLLTKIFEERDNWNFIVIPKLIEVESGSRNPGCAFSFLADAAWGQIFLIVMTFILLAVLIFTFVVLPEKHLLLKISLTLIISGALGNLIDRIAYREVRDFVNVNIFGSMSACNFADFWIVFGTVIAIIALLFVDIWAVFPLTKAAKAEQAKRRDETEGSGATTVENAGAEDVQSDGENTSDGENESDGGDGNECE